MKIQYKVCRLCGANLDPDEKCTCNATKEERIIDRPKSDALQHQLGNAPTKHETTFHFNTEIKKMEKLKGLSEAKSAIIRYKIFKMNYKDDQERLDYKDIDRFYNEFIEAFKNVPQETQEKEWLFFKGFIAGIEDEERLSHVN